MERGLYYGEATDVLGVFCRMVTSSVVGSGVSSHSTRVTDNFLCFCVFGGGVGEVGVGFRADEGGESSVVSSHSTWVKAKLFSRCLLGGGVGEVRARRGEVEGGGYSTMR